MIIGTAGHIDHGKTTLIKALTGVDTDRLPEEKARGITLDLGYAYTDDGLLGYVDVPGHEKLVHNMLAGATGIDFLLLTVAADDGPMPQTIEHLAIATLLGIGLGAVALTKTDAVSKDRLASVLGEIGTLLDDGPLAAAPVFPVAAPRGDGVAELHAHLITVARSIGERRVEGAFRLAIDRVFSLQGIGIVVTGTAISGRVSVGDILTISPPGYSARVRGLRVQDCVSTEGRAGQRVAVNLTGDFDKGEIARGMCLLAPQLHFPVTRFQCSIRAIEALRHWQPVHVHVGTSDIPGRLALLEGESVSGGGLMLAEVVLDRSASILSGDRFVLRDQSASRTVAGGRVSDVFPPARHKRSSERLALLRLMDVTDPAPALRLMLAQQPAGVDLRRYALGRNLDEPEFLWRALDLVVVEDGVERIGFTRAGWMELGRRLATAVADEHRRAPEMIGVDHDRLRLLTAPALARSAFNRRVAESVAEGSLSRTGPWLHLPEHRATLVAEDISLWCLLRPLLDAAPFHPPRVRDIANATGVAEEAVRRLMKRVARLGLVYPVAHDHYFSAPAIARLAEQVEALCLACGGVRAAALRDAIGGGRKVAVQILEFFDRVGYTRRVKDAHLLRDTSASRQWVVQ
jgi:selenocysteine-specific elongation factor